MKKNRLLELAGVPQKKEAPQQMLNEMMPTGVIEDIVHNAIWDVLNALKVKAPEHTVKDAIAAALHHYQGEIDHSEQY